MVCEVQSSARSYPKLPYAKIAEDILGADYQLTIVFVGSTRAHKLNSTYRGKTYIPNVLSFPLTRKVGEIYITPTVARKEAPSFGLSYRAYIGFLFIHGLLHLKGYDHGDTMESLEQKFMKKHKLG